LAGTVTIVKTNSSGATTAEVLATVTYAGTPFTNDSYPILYPANPDAAYLDEYKQVFAVGTATYFTINIGSLALPAGTYEWNYHVIGK